MSVSQTIATPKPSSRTSLPVLGAISLCHLLNDMMQSLLPAIYPILKGGFNLSFGQIGLLTFTFQVTGSLLQPMVGSYTDRRPQPYSLALGMGFTLAGMVSLALAPSYALLLAGAALLGIGSSIFHPESSRIARLASGGRHGLAQSVFQVGGNFGQALGPLLAAFLVLPHGRPSLAWFAFVALGASVLLAGIGHWGKNHGHTRKPAKAAAPPSNLAPRQVRLAIGVLIALMFSKFVYLSSINSYYIFYLMQRFHLPTQEAQIDLFVFLAASAVGVVIGGPLGDRIGRKAVIWVSILGILPFTLVLPYASLPVTIGLSIVIGLMLSSAFSTIVVYAQELLPGRVGMVSGLFFGLAFGLAGIGAAALGELADFTSIGYVYHLCAFLPAIGLLAVFLPDPRRQKRTL